MSIKSTLKGLLLQMFRLLRVGTETISLIQSDSFSVNSDRIFTSISKNNC